MREPPNISEEQLRTCLQEAYHLSAVALEFLPVGLDSRAGVYRVVSEQGTAYLLKAKQGTIYEPSCLVPRYLYDQGIDAVVAPLPTERQTLWTQLGEWTLILYLFLDGETGRNPAMSAAHWQAVGTALKQIHLVSLPTEGFATLRKETFDPTGYSRWVRAFEAEQLGLQSGDQMGQALRSSWIAQQATIHASLALLETLAERLRQQSGPQVICHADLHTSNMIRSQPNRVFLIDWDDVMLAPKERDFLFVGDPPANGAALQDAPPFFQGYGPTEIDWIALAYYRWERVVQDVIAFAEEACLRDDLGEATRAEAVQWFQVNLAGGGMLDAARAASQRANA